MGIHIQGLVTPFQDSSNLLFGVKPKPISNLKHRSLGSPPPPFVVFSQKQGPLTVTNRFSFLKTGSVNESHLRNHFLKPSSALITTTTTTTTSDLDVTIRSSSLVVPWEETERRTMFLSNIDQTVNMVIGVVLFFTANPNFSSKMMIKRLETAYRKVLVHYDFLAGRLGLNHEQGRLEIDCNSAGAGFVVASSELAMSEIGNLVCPNPAFEELVRRKWDVLGLDQTLITIQVTSFKCGGVSMGLTFNHAALDGMGFQTFMQNLASMISNNTLAYPPCNNRHLLASRSLPHVDFPHPELIKIEHTSRGGYDTSTPTPFQFTSDNLELKVLRLSPQDIANLKHEAGIGLKSSKNTNPHTNGITSFNVATAHIWRCMTLTRENGRNPEKTSTILYPINIRSRLRPRLPPNYSGNGIISVYGTATYRDFEERPLLYFVEKLAEGAKMITDEYVRSVIDWKEIYNGFAHGDILLSSWWKLGLGSVEFPWGKPKCTVPLVHQWSNIVLLLEDSEDVRRNEGVNVLVALPSKEFDKFQGLFYKHLY